MAINDEMTMDEVSAPVVDEATMDEQVAGFDLAAWVSFPAPRRYSTRRNPHKTLKGKRDGSGR